jgi:hypothetical protein
VAIAGLTAVTVADPDTVAWVSPRIAVDGLRMVTASSTSIVGIAETGHGVDDDREFRVDLGRRTATGGWVAEFASSA